MDFPPFPQSTATASGPLPIPSPGGNQRGFPKTQIQLTIALFKRYVAAVF